MFDPEQTIAEWRRQMAAGGIKTPEVLNELESHLREDVEQQERLDKAAHRQTATDNSLTSQS
jgi:ferritin-like metal-binding protein YciE